MHYYYFSTECPEGEERFPLTTDPFDAARFADGSILCRVDIRERDGEVIVRRVDAAEMIRAFARMQAEAVLVHWPAPDESIVRYLRTGEASLRGAARDAAWAAYETAQRAFEARRMLSAASAALAATSADPVGDDAYKAADAAAWTVGHVAYEAAVSKTGSEARAEGAWHAPRTEFLKMARDQFRVMVEELFAAFYPNK